MCSNVHHGVLSHLFCIAESFTQTATTMVVDIKAINASNAEVVVAPINSM